MCLRFAQITLIIFLRFMILHLSHLTLTEALTFIADLLKSVRDATLAEVIR